MKKLHRSDLYCWSIFDPEKNIDFNGILWAKKSGNIIIDPVPMEDHDKKHLEELGGASHVIITNSDHIRDTENILSFTGAKSFGPSEEKHDFPISCDYWLNEGDQTIEGVNFYSLKGSKTKGELAILIENTTLITGDLIRSQMGGKLCILPDEKLQNRDLAVKSVKRLAGLNEINAVIPGDGWPIFNYGHEALKKLCEEI